MQKVTHNGKEYTMNDLRQLLYDGEISVDTYNTFWREMQAQIRATEVQEYFDFSNEQMEEMVGNERQMRLLHEAMESVEQAEKLQYQLDEWNHWADNRPY